MTGKSWNVLGQGPGQDLVLAVDFSSTGRPMAGFRDLVPLLDPPLTMWETAMPTDSAVSPADYVDRWLAEVERSGRPVRAVTGYCAGAVLAAQIAERLAQRQEEPRLVLFDPELPNTAGLHRDFHAAGDSMAAMMAPGELARYHAAAQQVSAEFADDDVIGAGTALDRVFTATMTGIAERMGLDNEVRDELAGVFGTLVRYLAAAQLYDPRAMWARATAIRSTSATATEVGLTAAIRSTSATDAGSTATAAIRSTGAAAEMGSTATTATRPTSATTAEMGSTATTAIRPTDATITEVGSATAAEMGLTAVPEVGRDVVLDVSHDDLLRHTATACALSDLLGTATARGLA